MTRILLINPNTTSGITDRLTSYCESLAGPEIDFVSATGRFGARYISTRAAVAVAAHAALDALALNVAGCDAVYLACFGDPGLLALKEISPIPVVGMAEASCIEAAKGGRRFAIVTGGALWGPMLTEFVASLGLADQLATVATITLTGDQIANDPDGALGSLSAACARCVTDHRADIVILGGAALAGLASRIQPSVTVPVLCSVETGLHAVIAAAKKQPEPAAQPSREMDSVGLSPELSGLLRL